MELIFVIHSSFIAFLVIWAPSSGRGGQGGIWRHGVPPHACKHTHAIILNIHVQKLQMTTFMGISPTNAWSQVCESMIKYYILFNFSNQEVFLLKYFMDCRQHACTSRWKCGENKINHIFLTEIASLPIGSGFHEVKMATKLLIFDHNQMNEWFCSLLLLAWQQNLRKY